MTSVEITLEANPNSVEQERFRDYRAAGVNRVSIGVQALDDVGLQGPRPPARRGRSAQRRSPGAEHLSARSFDLIYARPESDAGRLDSAS